MSAHPVSHVFAAIDSTLVSDLTDLGISGAGSSNTAATEGTPAGRKGAAPVSPMDRVDPEPHWSATIDAATD